MATPGTDAALRRDVRLLGETLGRVLVEQGGPGLLAAEERIRELSRNARSTGSARARDELAEAVAALPLDRQADVLRAFSLYFQLANLAEQHHRLRRRRQYEHERRTPPESLAEALATLDRAGVTRRRLAAAAKRLSLELVLTAHPTEATRRTVLAAQLRLDGLLERLDDPALPRSERERIEASLAEEVTALWQTDEVRSQRPRVVDEIRHGLWFFEQSLLDVGTGARRRPSPQCPGGRHASALRQLDRRRPGREPERRTSDDRGGARPGPRAGAPALPRRGPRARGAARRRRHAGRRLSRAAPVDRAGRAGDAGLRGADRPDERARAIPTKALAGLAPAGRDDRSPARRVRVAPWLPRRARARRPQPAREPGRPARRRPPRGAATPGRAVRLPPGDARRPPARRRTAAADRADAAELRGHRPRAGTPRRGGDRHPDRLGDAVGARRARRPRARPASRRAPVGRAPVRDDRRPPQSARDRRRAPLRAAVPADGRGPRPAAGGDGRLLGLGQGRRLPDGAVGDLPGTGGARSARAAARGSS